MPKTREEILEQRRQIRDEYGDLFDITVALLFRYDPAGVNFEINPDEYQSEAGSILPRLRFCQSPDDVRRIVHEEFVRWFDETIAGPPERYTEIASEIWQLWQASRESSRPFRNERLK
jgi:hypothetical protein